MATQTQRSVPEVLNDIVGNVEMIIRSEFRLAKSELKEEADKAARPAATFGVGVAFGFYALGAFLLAAVYGLALIMSTWMAALLVGTVLSLVGIALTSSSSKQLKYLHAVPNKTIQSMEDNVQWAKDQIR
jgi:uncharacterized membrane protein YqjE